MNETNPINSKLKDIYYANILIFLILVLMKFGSLLISGIIKTYFSQDIQMYLFQGSGTNTFETIITLISQYIFILVPVICYLRFSKKNIKEILRLNKPTTKQIILTTIIAILTWMLSIFINIFVQYILFQLFGPTEQYMPSYLLNNNLIITIITLSITPAICEEILFRGVLLKAYSKLGINKAIFFTALIFALMHCSLNNFVAPIIVGIISAYMVYKSNSIYLGMILHGIFNITSIVIYKLLSNVENTTQAITLNISQTLIITISIIILTIIIKKLIQKFNEESTTNIEDSEEKVNLTYKQTFIYLKQQWSVYGFFLIYMLNILKGIGK